MNLEYIHNQCSGGAPPRRPQTSPFTWSPSDAETVPMRREPHHNGPQAAYSYDTQISAEDVDHTSRPTPNTAKRTLHRYFHTTKLLDLKHPQHDPQLTHRRVSHDHDHRGKISCRSRTAIASLGPLDCNIGNAMRVEQTNLHT